MADVHDTQYLPSDEWPAFLEIKKGGRWKYTFEKEVKAKVKNYQHKYGLFTIKVNDGCLVLAYLKDKDTMVITNCFSEKLGWPNCVERKDVIKVDDTYFIDNPSIEFTGEPKLNYRLTSKGPVATAERNFEDVHIVKGSAFRSRRKLSKRDKKSSFKFAQKRRKSKTTKRSRSPKSRRR